MKISTVFANEHKKAEVHFERCTSAEILLFPSVSTFLLVLLLLLLLFLAQMFTDRACFRFLVEQICHVTLAVVHNHRIVFLAISNSKFVNGGTFLFLTDGKPRIHQLGSIHAGGVLFSSAYCFKASLSSAEYFLPVQTASAAHPSTGRFLSSHQKCPHRGRSPKNEAVFPFRLSVPLFPRSAR